MPLVDFERREMNKYFRDFSSSRLRIAQGIAGLKDTDALDGDVVLAADERTSGRDEFRSLRQDGFFLLT